MGLADVPPELVELIAQQVWTDNPSILTIADIFLATQATRYRLPLSDVQACSERSEPRTVPMVSLAGQETTGRGATTQSRIGAYQVLDLRQKQTALLS